MSSDLIVAVMTGASVALVASAHCVLMCGPLVMMSHARGATGGTVRYLVGRLVSYTSLGALAGSAGRALFASRVAVWSEAVLSWLLAGALAFAAYKLLRGTVTTPGLVSLGRGPQRGGLGRALAHVAHDPLLLGAATALLPCGALFGAVAAAAALGGAASGALAMATFALLSGLSLVGAGQLARLVSLSARGRKVFALVLIAGGLVMVVRPLSSLRAQDAPPACPLHAGVR